MIPNVSTVFTINMSVRHNVLKLWTKKFCKVQLPYVIGQLA
jgi:hypothetical protein